MLRNTKYSYGSITKIFHWLLALLIVTMLVAGLTMTSLSVSPLKWQLYSLHKATGVVVLILVIFRLLWRLINIKVKPLSSLPIDIKRLAEISHKILYLMMFLMPISGMLMSLYGGHDINLFGLSTIKAFAKNLQLSNLLALTHKYSAFILAALITTHFFAALYHHYIRKDNILIRMI